LLDGQGADEIMGGYHKYYRWYWQELYKRNRLKESGELKAAHAIGVNEDFTIKHKIAALAPEFTTALLQSRKAKLAYRDAALHPDFRFSNRRNLYYATPATYDLNGVLYYNTVVNGLEELLRLADRNSMAHSVEVRLPFLHHKLVEFLFTLPSSFKIHEGWSKFLLRKAVDKKLPDEITWRKGKVGFEPPQEKWMMMPAVQDAIATGKKKLVETGILDRREIDKKIQPHHGYAADNREWKYWSASYLFT
jgi:asparagine synthase (glutamine-hydrolysing)